MCTWKLNLFIFGLLWCSWECHILGTSSADCCSCSANYWYFRDWPWIDRLDLRLRSVVRLSEVFRPLQCGVHSSSDIWCCPFPQISTLHSNVSEFSWNKWLFIFTLRFLMRPFFLSIWFNFILASYCQILLARMCFDFKHLSSQLIY